MSIDRRRFLTRAGLGAGALAPACRSGRGERAAAALAPEGAPPDWSAVRAEFLLSREHIHLALMLLTSHPRPVREAIERHRRGLDENPTEYFEERLFQRAEDEVRAAAAGYTGGGADDIALTDSTTMAPGGPLRRAAAARRAGGADHHPRSLRHPREPAADGRPLGHRRPASARSPSTTSRPPATEEEIAGRLQGGHRPAHAGGGA